MGIKALKERVVELLKKDGVVFNDFDANEGGRHVNSFEPDWSMRYIYAYDDGFVHPAVFLQMLYDPYDDHLYIFDELFEYEKETQEVCKSMMKKVYHWRQEGASTPWKQIADTAIFANKGQKTVASLIRMYTNINFTKSYKYDADGSLRMLQGRIKNNKLTIHPRCQNTIRQYRDLTWASGDNKIEKPIDKEDDSVDLGRYVCAELNQETKPIPPPPPKPYNQKSGNHKSRFKKLIGNNVESIDNEEKSHAWQSG